MDLDELEQELWRLRGVEYDLQVARETVEALNREHETFNKIMDSYRAEISALKAQNDTLKDELDEAKASRDKAQEKLQEALEKADAYERRLIRLYDELKQHDYEEYIKDTYDFRVVDKVPQVTEHQRRGWRLTK